jgi:hypothetical protein
MPVALQHATAAATLSIGPWIGEFGHELMFVGMARARAQKYERVVAYSREESRAFYADFVDEFVPHDIQCEGMCARATRETMPSAAMLRAYCEPGTLPFPGRVYAPGQPAKWRKYGTRRAEYADAVVIHARARPHVPMRNWPQRNWNRLARRLFRKGLAQRVVCVGLRHHALAVEGAVDLRNAPLERQMDALASARFAIGPSSGPMHLAQHCGCPVLIWCGGPSGERKTTRARYVRDWNPFQVAAHAHEWGSWQPPFDTVWAWLETFPAARSG